MSDSASYRPAGGLYASASWTVPAAGPPPMRRQTTHVWAVRYCEPDDAQTVHTAIYRQRPAAWRHAAQLRARGYLVAVVAGTVTGWTPCPDPRGGGR